MEKNRRSIRVKEFDYSQEGLYAVTICTQNKHHIFGEIDNGEMILNKYGKIAKKHWTSIPNRYPNVKLDKYIIMPNHVHLIVEIKPLVGAIHELPLPQKRRNMLLPKLIGYYKMNSSKQINQIKKTPGYRLWQRNYYEHIIRNEKDLSYIRYYIDNNPSNWEKDHYLNECA
ncbi:MAG: hypothetical protein PHQ52_06630 [Candidatus Omnitrophica bacterium]|nr:hypothetical protein [Candidatus Omnitrophota bacterium]